MAGATVRREGAVPVSGTSGDGVPTAGLRRSLLAYWYAPLFFGLLPVLLCGFVASALANRLAFAGWAIVMAVAHASLLRVTYDVGWAGRIIAGAALITQGLGFVAFAALVERHGEILDLGYRAALPALHHPLLTRPTTYLVLAAVLALAGAVRLSIGPAAPGPRSRRSHHSHRNEDTPS